MSAAQDFRHPIDIEEFERRLRAPEPVKYSDPLAELARLVSGAEKAGGDPFAGLVRDGGARLPSIDHGHLRPVGFEAPPVQRDVAAEPHIGAPELRGALEDHFAADPRAAAPAVHAEPVFDEFDPTVSTARHFPPPPEQAFPQDDYEAPEAPAARSKKPLILTGAVIGATMIAIGSTFAFMKGAKPTNGGEIATIKASSTPAKIAAPNEKTESAAADSSLLDKSVAAPAVKQAVTRSEPPIDVTAAPKQPRIIGLTENDVMSPALNAALKSAAPAPAAKADAAATAEPRKVKTVSVRADGSIISSETAAAPAPAAPRSATPKTSARVATTPGEGRAKATRSPTTKTALAKPSEQGAEDLSHGLAPRQREAHAAPAAATTARGGFAIQLAAPATEAEAKSVAARLGAKYASALGGHKLGVHKAADKNVYRVRAAGFSRDAAQAACSHIKSAGGACFISGN
ncbi:MAG: SPOR domain-containing protein [Hyphomicrobiales bacterium]|nr:SPOR domain-containing protein [Hyphomicrobiales bacterium]